MNNDKETASSDLAHVARQRQESTSEYSQVSSEHFAAVAEQLKEPTTSAKMGSIRDEPEFWPLMQRWATDFSTLTLKENPAALAIVRLIDGRVEYWWKRALDAECSTDRAAVAEGVDTDDRLACLLHHYAVARAKVGDDDASQEAAAMALNELTAHIDGLLSQQREAGRREERAKLHPFKPATDAHARQPVSEGLTLPKVFGVSRDAESPGGKGVLVSFHRALTDDELRAFHDRLSAVPPAKAEGISDTERLDYLLVNFTRCASLDMSGVHAWAGVGRTIGRGTTARDAIDRAILAQQTKKGGAA